MLRILDRMIYEHREDENKAVYERLRTLASIPRKEKPFITHVSGFCHISEEEAGKIWNEIAEWEKEILKEKRAYRKDRVCELGSTDPQKSVNKALKAEAKRVTRMEQREKQTQEKKEKMEKKDQPPSAITLKWGKQVAKLIRTNLDVLIFLLIQCRTISRRMR